MLGKSLSCDVLFNVKNPKTHLFLVFLEHFPCFLQKTARDIRETIGKKGSIDLFEDFFCCPTCSSTYAICQIYFLKVQLYTDLFLVFSYVDIGELSAQLCATTICKS